jgi:hypothetical protein
VAGARGNRGDLHVVPRGGGSVEYAGDSPECNDRRRTEVPDPLVVIPTTPLMAVVGVTIAVEGAPVSEVSVFIVVPVTPSLATVRFLTRLAESVKAVETNVVQVHWEIPLVGDGNSMNWFAAGQAFGNCSEREVVMVSSDSHPTVVEPLAGSSCSAILP